MEQAITTETVLTVITALGGFEAIKWGITSLINRKAMKKQADAQAIHADLSNLNDYADSWRELYLEAKNDIREKDTKIDSLYAELKKIRECKAEHIKNEHQLELEIEALKIKKCDIRGCETRKPPSDY